MILTIEDRKHLRKKIENLKKKEIDSFRSLVVERIYSITGEEDEFFKYKEEKEKLQEIYDRDSRLRCLENWFYLPKQIERFELSLLRLNGKYEKMLKEDAADEIISSTKELIEKGKKRLKRYVNAAEKLEDYIIRGFEPSYENVEVKEE